MAAKSAPFGYMIIAGGNRPVLISAGADGVMQTTDETFVPSAANYGVNDTRGRRCDDQYTDLAPWKDPALPLLEDTADDQAAQSDTPGNDQQP